MLVGYYGMRNWRGFSGRRCVKTGLFRVGIPSGRVGRQIATDSGSDAEGRFPVVTRPALCYATAHATGNQPPVCVCWSPPHATLSLRLY